MHDTQGRSIRYLRLSITDRCNCRCRYCMPAQGVPLARHEDLLSFEELEAIVRAAVEQGIHKVRLTGGEPLVRRGVVELVERLARIEGVDELAMTTNATLLAPLATDLHAAGLDRINVSLDSLDADRYRAITRCGRLFDALAGIEAARAAGFAQIKINTVLLGGVNEPDIRPLALLARDEGLPVRFIELMPMGPSAAWPKKRFASADMVLRVLPELARVGGQGVAELYAAPGWKAPVGLIRPLSHRFCGSCDRVRVTSDGRLKPCLHAPIEIDVRGLSGPELSAALAEGIRCKPAGHDMDILAGRASGGARPMNRIGG